MAQYLYNGINRSAYALIVLGMVGVLIGILTGCGNNPVLGVPPAGGIMYEYRIGCTGEHGAYDAAYFSSPEIWFSYNPAASPPGTLAVRMVEIQTGQTVWMVLRNLESRLDVDCTGQVQHGNLISDAFGQSGRFDVVETWWEDELDVVRFNDSWDMVSFWRN